jgi:aminoglycoside/choline kinase family phosphotransferase
VGADPGKMKRWRVGSPYYTDAMTRASEASIPTSAARSSPVAAPLQDPTGQDARLSLLRDWLARFAGAHGLALETIRPASNDASFRRYFRIDVEGGRQPSLIAMDAPPPQEDCRPFVHAASVLRDAGLHVPAVIEADLSQGFLLLEDLGADTLLDRLACEPGEAEVDRLYRGAAASLVKMQRASRAGVFPEYDRTLLERELMLYPDWYLARHRELSLDDQDRNTLRKVFDTLLANNLAQPRVFVHRDFHSRNLMTAEGTPLAGAGMTADRGTGADLPGDAWPEPGVLDFQDAVHGPVTYDLVSLLRDAYVAWPEERQLDWAVRWWEAARAAGIPVATDFSELWRDLEWMGLQRHLKVLGIFARLYYRDGKDRYLADMPRVLASVREVAARYRAFAELGRLIDRVENQAARAGRA